MADIKELRELVWELYQKEPPEMSPSYEFVIGWNNALDAVLERLDGEKK